MVAHLTADGCVHRTLETDVRLEPEAGGRLRGQAEDLVPQPAPRHTGAWSEKIAERIWWIVSSSSPTADSMRAANSGGARCTVLSSARPVANRRWMTVSWRSAAMRSRSSHEGEIGEAGVEAGVLDGDGRRPREP